MMFGRHRAAMLVLPRVKMRAGGSGIGARNNRPFHECETRVCPASSPVMSPTTCTSSPVLVNVTVPVTWLPDFDSSLQSPCTSCPCATSERAHTHSQRNDHRFHDGKIRPHGAGCKLTVAVTGRWSRTPCGRRNRQCTHSRLRTAKRLQTSIDQALLDPGIGIDPAIAKERPMRSMFVHPVPIDLGHDDLFLIDAPFRDDFAAGRDDEALPPELDPVARRPALRDRPDSPPRRNSRSRSHGCAASFPTPNIAPRRISPFRAGCQPMAVG